MRPVAVSVAAAVVAATLSHTHARTISLTFNFKSGGAATVKEAPPTDSGNCTGKSNPFSMLWHTCLCEPCDLCKYDFLAGECKRITPVALSTSNGADEAVQQPELSAEKWFLTDDEMTASRGGVARNALSLWTPNNTVSAFVATNEYFDAVYKDLEASVAEDKVYIAGWSFDDVPLRPQLETIDEVNATKVVAVLQRLATKKVDFHVLGWDNVLESSQNQAFKKAVNAITPPPPQGGAYFLLDDRLPDATASHHQKTVVIQRAKGGPITAYIGGTDLTWDRWDTVSHDQSDLRKKTGIAKGSNLGWMDAHMKVVGPAANDVGYNFLQRWNMKQKPLGDLIDKLTSSKNPPYTSLPELSNATGETASGSHAVQIVRTYSCDYKHYDEFAPHGELSVFHARLKAIKMAKNFVFIEDQYFLHVPELMDALLEVLPQLQRVIIVSQPASKSSTRYGFRKYQWQMVAPLTEKYPHKVQVLRTKEDRAVYIHSKLVIVDDVFLSIGSSNWNRRSMTTDTEISANVVDSELVDTPDGVRVSKLARDYRVRKFMELTGRSYDELNGMKLLASFDALAVAAKDSSTLVGPLVPEQDTSFILYTEEVQSLADPLKLCTAKH